MKMKGLGVAGGAGVFTGPQEKKERQADHVGASHFAIGGGEVGLEGDVAEDGDRNRFDAQGGVVDFAVGR